ncbi:hypothetical protein [Streptomyces sp. CC210A]|uniref:hypothetical protein n=1 Tax=Streptomyces sp. CC210A TaxID=2898184 RepID=UPI001F466AB6|nr:hypothetical protein [Streptomyces sp. CC210A]
MPPEHRVPRRAAVLLAALAAVLPAGQAVADPAGTPASVAAPLPGAAGVGQAAQGDGGRAADEQTARCGTTVEGSRVTAHCHNPYPRTDRVQLHVECARWWDLDVDSAPVDVPPTAHVQLTERCWKEVRAVWLTHRPAAGPAGT